MEQPPVVPLGPPIIQREATIARIRNEMSRQALNKSKVSRALFGDSRTIYRLLGPKKNVSDKRWKEMYNALESFLFSVRTEQNALLAEAVPAIELNAQRERKEAAALFAEVLKTTGKLKVTVGGLVYEISV